MVLQTKNEELEKRARSLQTEKVAQQQWREKAEEAERRLQTLEREAEA